MKTLYTIFLVCGYIFAKSGYQKLLSGSFPQSLGATLEKFASKNPYPPVKDFLNQMAIPNSYIFGLLTMWGEIFAGVAIVLSSLYLVFRKEHKFAYLLLAAGLFVGAFLNLNFWLSAGWTSPSTESLNLLMFIIQLAGLIFASKKLLDSKK